MIKIKYSARKALILSAITLAGCNSGGGANVNPDGGQGVTSPIASNGDPTLATISPYQPSEIGAAAVTCAKLTLQDKSCLMEDIQPLGSSVMTSVSIEEVKSRIVTSHPWMAESFIAALQQINDPDLLNLFKPLNAIVLSYDVRPSFYSAYTASIYIDPRYLWRNKSEWNSIYQQDDYRGKFQSEFITRSANRYIDPSNSDYVTWSNSFNEHSDYTQRNAQMIAPGLYRLLAHELAHANDYLSAHNIQNLADSGRIYHDNMKNFKFLRKELYEAMPLTSTELRDAAWVAFHGYPMTDEIRQLTGEKAGSLFEGDGGAMFYAYSKSAEDVATLFEIFMMYKKYRAISDVAFVSIPTSSSSSCDDQKVQWGQRARLADKEVKQRALFVASRILQRDVSNELVSLQSAPIAMPLGQGWCESRNSTNAYYDVATQSMNMEVNPVVHDYRDDFTQE